MTHQPGDKKKAKHENQKKLSTQFFTHIIEGSLEVKLPTLWTVEMQR
jgi:hypothetical protein